jgi:hypothetical protein
MPLCFSFAIGASIEPLLQAGDVVLGLAKQAVENAAVLVVAGTLQAAAQVAGIELQAFDLGNGVGFRIVNGTHETHSFRRQLRSRIIPDLESIASLFDGGASRVNRGSRPTQNESLEFGFGCQGENGCPCVKNAFRPSGGDGEGSACQRVGRDPDDGHPVFNIA